MPDEPDTADLIELARAVLKAEVLPHLPEERRYPALMAINALGIAARQLASGASWRAATHARLAAIAGTDPAAAEARLATTLRRGEIPGDAGALHEALCAAAAAATAESNPKARALSDRPSGGGADQNV